MLLNISGNGKPYIEYYISYFTVSLIKYYDPYYDPKQFKKGAYFGLQSKGTVAGKAWHGGGQQAA